MRETSMTLKQLQAEATRLNIAGRSKMNKAQLEVAVAEALKSVELAASANPAEALTISELDDNTDFEVDEPEGVEVDVPVVGKIKVVGSFINGMPKDDFIKSLTPVAGYTAAGLRRRVRKALFRMSRAA